MKRTLAAALAMALGSSVHAADLGTNYHTIQPQPDSEKPLKPMDCWGAAAVGFAVARTDVTDGTDSLPIGADGALADVSAGCDFNLSRTLIVGPWGSFSLTDTDARIGTDGDDIVIKIDSAYALGGRLGFKIADYALIFGKVAYAGGEIDGVGDRLEGIQVGGGVETRVSKHLWLRLEADHTMYETESKDGIDAEDPTSTAVKAGVVVKF